MFWTQATWRIVCGFEGIGIVSANCTLPKVMIMLFAEHMCHIPFERCLYIYRVTSNLVLGSDAFSVSLVTGYCATH